MFYIARVYKGVREIIDETKDFAEAQYLVKEYQSSYEDGSRIFYTTRKGRKKNGKKA